MVVGSAALGARRVVDHTADDARVHQTHLGPRRPESDAGRTALEVGSLDKIAEQLASVREELERQELAELVEMVESCREALSRGELEEFRRLRETVVSKLGHLRVKLG